MYLTGWTALLAALGAVPALWSTGRTFAWVWVLGVLTLALMIATCSPARSLRGAPGELGAVK